jgi:hypothetical protein
MMKLEPPGTDPFHSTQTGRQYLGLQRRPWRSAGLLRGSVNASRAPRPPAYSVFLSAVSKTSGFIAANMCMICAMIPVQPV